MKIACLAKLLRKVMHTILAISKHGKALCSGGAAAALPHLRPILHPAGAHSNHHMRDTSACASWITHT